MVEGEVEEEDSRELRGRIRIATMMPSSVPLLLVAVSVVGLVEEGASLVDIVLSEKRSDIDRMLLLLFVLFGFKTNAASAYDDCS